MVGYAPTQEPEKMGLKTNPRAFTEPKMPSASPWISPVAWLETIAVEQGHTKATK